MNKLGTASFALAALCAVAIITPAAARADEKPQHIRGSIVAVTDTALTVKSATGTVTITLGPKFAVAGATAGTLDDVTPGKFLGIASAPENGTNRALEVTVFDESMRGTAEGDGPWDSPTDAMTHSSMTNGTVALPGSGSNMTNGTAGTLEGGGKKTVTVAYKDGSRKVVLPANVPVVRVAPGTRALLKEGASVFVLATPATPPSAIFVVVGQNGTKVPL